MRTLKAIFFKSDDLCSISPNPFWLLIILYTFIYINSVVWATFYCATDKLSFDVFAYLENVGRPGSWNPKLGTLLSKVILSSLPIKFLSNRTSPNDEPSSNARIAGATFY